MKLTFKELMAQKKALIEKHKSEWISTKMLAKEINSGPQRIGNLKYHGCIEVFRVTEIKRTNVHYFKINVKLMRFINRYYKKDLK